VQIIKGGLFEMIYKENLNKKLFCLERSPTLSLTSLAKKLKKEGKDVVNFAAGEPDFDTPHFVKEAAKKAIENGFTKYTPTTGILDLKELIAQKLKEKNGLIYSPDNIILTTGAKFAIFLAMFSLINDSEEVILPSPYWVSYPQIAKIVGAKLKILPTKKEENFKITPHQLKKAISNKSKVLVLNYPTNPTGVTYTREELEAIWNSIRDTNIFIISDEIYEDIVFDGIQHISFASLKDASQRTVTINGFSKSFSMTGWRLGYMVGPKEVIEQASKIVDHTTSCPNSIAQKGAIAALKDTGEWHKRMKEEFQERRDLIYNELADCKYVDALKPQGTFYLFCDIRRTNLSSFEFSSKLLQNYLVAVIPSEGFGIQGFIRVSFSTSKENIKKGVARIREFVNSIASN
jgi:aspartate aminotransferase